MHGTILAFDFGLRRIGVAVGQTVTQSASPLATLSNRDSGTPLSQIRALIAEWQPDCLIVGVPERAHGGPSDIEPQLRAFIAEIEEFGLPIETVDESHTSREAQARLTEARRAGSRGRIHKEHIDSAAAVLIAERWLDVHAG